jgi:hypothetical protein
MGGERASTTRQRERGKICCRCKSSIPPPYPWRERLCGKCEAAVTYNVYARFWREGLVWRVALSDMSGNSRIRDFTFAGSDKIEALAERGGSMRDLAAKAGHRAGHPQPGGRLHDGSGQGSVRQGVAGTEVIRCGHGT